MRNYLKFLLTVAVMTLAKAAYAGKPLVAEAPINDHGTSVCVSASTSAWTAIPTSNLAGRVGLYVTVIDTAAANMSGQIADSLPTQNQFFGPILLKPGITQFHGLADSETLYIKSKNSTAEVICAQEVKQ